MRFRAAAVISCMLLVPSAKTALAFASRSTPRSSPLAVVADLSLVRRRTIANQMTTTTASDVANVVAPPTTTIDLNLEDHSPSYRALLDKLRTISHLNSASSVLNYDRQVFMSSKSDGASSSRGRQLATLASISHEMSTDPNIGALIRDATRDLDGILQTTSSSSSLTTARRVLELEGEAYEKRTCIPKELAARKAELEAAANRAWVKVRWRDVCSVFGFGLGFRQHFAHGRRRKKLTSPPTLISQISTYR
jgi:hypothetical protein